MSKVLNFPPIAALRSDLNALKAIIKARNASYDDAPLSMPPGDAIRAAVEANSRALGEFIPVFIAFAKRGKI